MAHPYRSQFTLTLPGKGTISTRYHFGRTNSAGSRGGFGFEINSGIVPGSGPPIRCIHSMAPQLLAADDGVALNFDLGFGNGQGGDGDERAAGELVAGFFERGIDELEDLPHLSVEIAGERLAGIVDDRELPGQPHDLAALGDHRLRVAARLRTLALEELLGVQRSSEAEQQRRRDEADESA